MRQKVHEDSEQAVRWTTPDTDGWFMKPAQKSEDLTGSYQ